MTDGVRMTVGDLGEVFDGPHATPTRRDWGSNYFLNISSLQDGRLDLSRSDRIDDHDFDVWTRRVTPSQGDVLFSYETRLGEAALMPDNVRACLGRRMALLRPDPEVVDSRYLLYYWLSPAFQQMITQRAVSGATVQRILLSELPHWPVVIPTLSTQQAVAEVLGALDDKIAANDRVVELADEARQALWAQQIKGASQVPLSSVAQFVNGGAYTKGATGSGRPVIRIAEMNQGISGSTVFNDLDVPSDREVSAGDFLMAWSGSLGSVRWHHEDGILNQHIFKVIPGDENPLWAVASAVERQIPYFRFVASNKATTMGHIQRHHLDELVPWPELTDSAIKIGDSLWNRALAAELESQTLAATRDELLPLLMSGKVTVRDAGERVEEVV